VDTGDEGTRRGFRLTSAVDTNVISAIWANQSAELAEGVLNEARLRGSLIICGIVYAELLAHPHISPRDAERFLLDSEIKIEASHDQDLWREAGLCYRNYSERRRRAKHKSSRRPVADFVIGAHALLRADCLLTFNAADYRRDFPRLKILPGRLPQ